MAVSIDIKKRTPIERLTIAETLIQSVMFDLSSAQQERKTGKNIYEQAKGHCEFKCSMCGAEIGVVEGGDLDGANGFNFCPACGAEMKGDSDGRSD